MDWIDKLKPGDPVILVRQGIDRGESIKKVKANGKLHVSIDFGNYIQRFRKHKAMFTPLDVAFIRELLKQKAFTRRELAERYHVSYSTIADIQRRRTYPSELY